MNTKYEIFIGLTTNQGEKVDPDRVVWIASRYFQGATITKGTGIWQGELEDSLTVTVYGSADDEASVLEFARVAKQAFRQDAVLVIESAVVSTLI